jgi:MFS family permease
MVWRSGRYQVFLIFDGALTAGLAAMVGLIVATFIHKDWTISGGWWDVFGVILLIGVIAAFQRFVHRNLDSMLTPDGESDDERIRRLLREVLDERPGEA